VADRPDEGGTIPLSHIMTSSIYRQFINISAAAAIIAIASVPAPAQSLLSAGETASEINAANKLLRDGKVDEALEAFRHVVPGDQQRSELNYNMAVAEYRKGNIAAAEKLFGEVAGTSGSAISANSRYNLGNCQYAKAVQVAEQDKPAAIEHLRNAVSHYRGALRGDSNNPDARANIELAGALIRKLEEEQKQEEQKKQEQEQQDKEDKTNKEQQQDQKEQPEQNDGSQKESEQQKSDSKDSNSDQQKKEDQKDQSEASASDKSKKDEQKKDAQKNENPGDKSQKPDDPKPDDQKSPGEESQSSQQKPSEPQAQPKDSDGKQTQPQNMQQKSGDQQQLDDEGKPEEQEAKNQPVPDGDLKAAGQQDENKKPVGSGAMADPNSMDGLMTREEALKMLQSVRDRDMLRRMQQQRLERSRHIPVDRDW